ncbi:MAG: CBS domain-containing protein [Planctomycetota bacterium]
MARCRDIMSSPVTTVSPSMTLSEVSRIFAEEGISGAPVVDHRGKLIGVVSQTDIVRRCMEAADTTDPPSLALRRLGVPKDHLSNDEDSEEEVFGPVEEFMSSDPFVVGPDTPVEEVAREMALRRIHRVIVVEGERIVGIVTSLDLLASFGAKAAPRGGDRHA